MDLKGTLKIQKVFAVLLLVCADWPACGDCLGSMDHSGEMGCGMCQGGVKKKHVQLWIGKERTRQEHVDAAKRFKQSTKPAREALYKATGLRPCALLALEYLVPSQVQVAEPMHNVYLGLGLDVFEACKESNFLPKAVFPDLERKARFLRVPREECARPINGLGSNATGLKADQVCTFVYSMCINL